MTFFNKKPENSRKKIKIQKIEKKVLDVALVMIWKKKNFYHQKNILLCEKKQILNLIDWSILRRKALHGKATENLIGNVPSCSVHIVSIQWIWTSSEHKQLRKGDQIDLHPMEIDVQFALKTEIWGHCAGYVGNHLIHMPISRTQMSWNLFVPHRMIQK